MQMCYYYNYMFTPFLPTLVLPDSLMARYPGGRLQETGMLNSCEDMRPSLRIGSHEYPTKIQTNKQTNILLR